MTGMVERVARAIDPSAWDERPMYGGGEPGPQETELADLLKRAAREPSLRQARAAIEAMREPTEAMIAAARDPLSANGSPMSKGPHEVFRAMIAAALAE